MNVKKIINTMYENIIGVVLENIDSKYTEEIKSEFLKYLNRLYGNEPALTEEFQMKSIEWEKNVWRDISPDFKLSMILQDENFRHIEIISRMADDLVLKKITKKKVLKMDVDLIHETENLLRELLTQVREFNKEMAERLVSEAIGDLEYLINENSMSVKIIELLGSASTK